MVYDENHHDNDKSDDKDYDYYRDSSTGSFCF